ncbi:MAG: hypothetical protein QOC81_3253 [Thermoanaerobaculia bacterium]|jgi:hypothetical protein|nr:hypothetical protein [Thermoanaerobaculia bacterium]
MTIDPQRVRDFMTGFFGYGHLGAKYWFVGLEEGAMADLEEFERRLLAWDAAGRQCLVDIRQFHRQLGGRDWFSGPIPLQRTWRPLIRTRYAAEGVPFDAAELKKYQSVDLASAQGDTALLELRPLPARKTTDWIYGSLDLPELRTREHYEAVTTPRRRDQIIKLIDTFQPRAVVTYGDAASWRQTLAANTSINAKAWAGRKQNTIVVCTHHPEGARSNAHWDEIGQFIRDQS